MSRPGDWNCRSCQYLNFQRRDSCQRCGDSKSGDLGGFGGRGGGPSSFGFGTGSDVRPGDWYCAAGNSSVVVVVIVLVGNLEIGFAPGLDAMNTTLLAEWNVSDAMPQGTLVTGFHTKHITHHFRVLQATKS
ncbi:hypothetical protein LWI28_024478 [Acer negundo]|uniref:RanBP2-type domain-containing protein n=1 Tax=Acer negundo TaxID=4023 RepID=A0AAD5IK84_ACENE|nr:hypothetical protein LWI28_024478 [Acer negundo]